MNTYPVKSIARLWVAFTDESASFSDPSTVQLTIVTPDGKKAIHADVTHTETGHYSYDFTVSAAGVHKYKWQGDGDLVAANAYQKFRGIE